MFTIGVKWQKMARLIFAFAVIGIAAHTGYLTYSIFTAKEMRVGGPIPYTVILQEASHRSDGAVSIAQESTWAVRSDGSMVRWIRHKSSAQSSERTIQFASGDEVAINELTNIKSSTVEKNVNSALWQRDPGSKCINSFAGTPMSSLPEIIRGEESVDGYRTVKVTSNNVAMWYALDYGCAKVKARADWDSRSFSEHTLLALIPGEPDPALFHVPENAKEAPPSERLQSSHNESDRPCGQKCLELLQKFDARYYAHRPAR
ncbi:MAG: hypothetical protein SF339_24590 [Blastocatellia bacterium]|nr:hypothetical protein [Blastocatellia bacterium]